MRMANKGNYIIKTLTVAMTVFAFVLGFTARVEAAGVQWAPGFPKLTDGKVLLMWNAVSGAEEYKVYRRRGDTGDFVLLTKSKVNRHIAESPEGGYTYGYKVAAVKGGKEFAESDVQNVTLKAEKKFVPMSVPDLVGAHYINEADGTASAGVRWEMEARPTDLAAYNVYRSEKKGGPYTLIGSSQAMDYRDKDLQRGKTYYYTVTAVDTNFKETARSKEMAVEVPTLKATAGPSKKPTEMMRAKLLYNITTFTTFNREGKPVENKIVFPVDISVDEAVGHIYVASSDFGGVLTYNMDGKFQFGIREEGRGSSKKLRGTHGICVGPDGKIYLVSYGMGNIYIYDLTGKLDNIIEVKLDDLDIKNPKPGKKPQLYDVAVNSMGDIFAMDPTFNRVHVYDYRGRYKYDIDGTKKRPGTDEQLFNGPGYACIDGEDHLLMADTSTGDILEFDKDGRFVKVFVEGGSSMGLAGKTYRPTGICVDKKGRVFVANGLDPNIQVFDKDGNLLFALSNDKMDGPIKSNNIRGIYVDAKGRIFVTEVMSGTVAVYQLSEKIEKIVVPIR